jgi:5-methylthioadenosine/S-adenosylhomocysteine deaminase
MKHPRGKTPLHRSVCTCCNDGGVLRADGTSRRGFLAATAALAAAGAASLPAMPVRAQGSDPELSQLQSQRRIVLKGGVVLTLDRQVGDFAQADLLIEDGKIRDIRPNIAASTDAAAVVDASNRIVIPGFVDTHSHSYQGLMRNILANGLLNPDYNRDIQTTLTPAYSADDAYAGVLLSALGFIDMGTTAIVDISQCSHTPEHSDAMIRALNEAGIRAVYSYHRGAGDKHQYPQDIKRLAKTHFNSKEQLLTLALTANLNANVYSLAREVGVQIVQHLVGKDLNKQVTDLQQAGLMRPGDEYIHCIGINDATWKLLKDAGAEVSLCAPIDMTMGHGTPTIQEALDHNFRPSLSSDHGVNLTQDMFSLMRATFQFQRLRAHERRRAGDKNPPAFLNCRDRLEFATIAGGRCAHVEAVFVAGKVKKWRGNLVGVDHARILRMAQQARDAVMKRANYKIDLLG